MIEIKNLQKVISGRNAVDIPVLSIQEGEVAALVGSAGSGKRTLFQLLSGKIQPTAGKVTLAGVEPFRKSRQLSQFTGFLLEQDGLYPTMTPRSNLEFQARLYGLSSSRVDEVLRAVGLADHARENTQRLSSSLLRRLAFGRGILHDPRLLILFEPFQDCDGMTVELLGDIITDLAVQGKTILILSTNHPALRTICDTLYILEQGRITGSAHPRDEQEEGFPFKIPVRTEDKTIILLNPADVLYAYALEGKTSLVTMDGEYPTQYTLTDLEERLIRSGFFRAHRGYLVNLQHVREVIPFTRNSFSLRLNNPAQTEIPLSKSAARELSELLGY
jgi:ABC-2 type transport system ATP-binding protein